MTGSPDSDTRAAAHALFTATTIIALQVAGKATRDALFLSHFDVTTLPRIVVAAAVASIAAVLVISKLLARYGPVAVMPKAFTLSACLFLGEWVCYSISAPAAAILLYFHMAIFGGILISGFWSVVNERFDPHTAKSTIARIAAAATLGGVIGGVVAERVATLIDIQAMLIVLSLLHGGCIVGIRGIGAPRLSPARDLKPNVRSAVQVLRTTPYLVQMALLVVLVAVTAGFLDYALKSTAASSLQGGEALVTFFASFYAAIGVVTFLVQTGLGARALQRLGLVGAIALLPGSVMVSTTLGAFIPRLATVALARASESVLANSFFRSGFELLYTPVAASRKRPTKTIIDVGCNRIGDMIGGGVLLALLFLLPDIAVVWILVLAMAAAALQLVLVLRLHRGYIAQLAASLRDGPLTVEIDETLDATTRRILAESSPASEREQLLSKIRDRQEQARRHRLQPAGGGADTLDAPGKAALPYAAAIDDLSSGDPERIRRTLNSPSISIEMAPFLLKLLGDQNFADDARVELRWMVPRIVGQLTDALVDPDTPVVIRQRIPSVLEVHHNPRSRRGLLEGLWDPEFAVRYSCSRALGRMRSRDRNFSVPEQRIFEAVEREVTVEDAVWNASKRIMSTEMLPDAGEYPARSGAEYSLRQVFSLLALVLDPDATRLAMYALTSRDQRMRGTSLEYLENVLPDEICNELWRHIGVHRRARKTQSRDRWEIVEELRRVVAQKRGYRSDSG